MTRRGMTLIETMISLTILTMMVVSVWSSFSGTRKNMEASEEIQLRYASLRNGLARITTELGMAYLSGSRPPDATKHYTMFEGRNRSDRDDLTFSAFAHLRVRRDANESDQSVIQYFMAPDPDDASRMHLYRRESRRLTGDRPEDMEHFFPAYILIEDVTGFDAKYWDDRALEWIDEWRTMQSDAQPDRLPERVKITITIKDTNGQEVPFVAQTSLPIREPAFRAVP